MGYGVNDSEVFPYRVQEELKKSNFLVKSLNYGIGNTGNGRNLLIVQNKINEIKPDLIIMQFTSNDMQDNKNERMFSFENEQLKFLGIRKDGYSTFRKIFELFPILDKSYLISFIKENRHVVKGMFKINKGVIPDKKSVAEKQNNTLSYAIIEKTLEEIQKYSVPVVGIGSGDFQEETLKR